MKCRNEDHLPTEPEFISVKRACELLGDITRTTLWRWRRDGKINTYKMSGRVLLNRQEIINLIRNGKQYR